MKKIISIVGHTNVGKSTLFNYLAGYRKAITHYSSGVTRDRIYCDCKWKGNKFTLIDSGGYVIGKKDLQIKICEQFLFAIEESTDVIFVIDILSGILPIDYNISNILQRSKKKVFLAINKIDQYKSYIYETQDILKLGFNDYFFISSYTGQGINELLNSIFSNKKEILIKLKTYHLPRITLVGRKNVGKSSLINTLLNKNQSIVCDLPGTTRDCIEVIYKKFNFKCILIDTAGIIKKKRKKEDLEYFSFIRTTQAISNSDLCFLIIDIQIGFNTQDLKILKIIQKNFKGIIILINKCDLIKHQNLIKHQSRLQNVKNKILKTIYPFTDIPIYFTSNFYKKNIIKAFKQAISIIKKQNKKINTSYFNKIMLPILKKNKINLSNGRNISIKYCVPILKQGIKKFIFFSNNPKLIPMSYKRFLEKQIRSNFDLIGIPIQIKFKQK
ncbi:ribosome biogenesis GTPase Der [Candidatus Karelsulcia muelleri]